MSSAFYSFISSITNSVTSKYDIKHQISTAGLWKIYQGERKTTGKKVALFVFEKKLLDSIFKRDRGSSRHDNELIYELLKKEAGNLARLRHPSILEVVEPVSESRSSIIFVTEPLIGCLTHLIKSEEHYSSDSQSQVLELDELEIQKGLLQVGKGLQFLNDAKVVHHNLTTDAVFVNAKGDWKIGGLGFGVFLNSGSTGEQMATDAMDYLPEACQINLDYAAPEYVLDNSIIQANDMFSLGCLAYAVHNKGESILRTFNTVHSYEKQLKTLHTQTLSNIPVHLRDVIRQLLTRHPNQRMDPESFQTSKYFDNLLVSTMKFLESFPEKTKEEKTQFMKGLPRVLGQFPERVLKRKILPSLLDELKDSQLLPYTIPNVFLIAEQFTKEQFCDHILPSLKPVFLVRDPPQNMIVLLEKLDILQQRTTREVFRDDVMPLVYAALENPAAIVQEKALRIIPSLAESLDYTTIKSSLFPRVQTVFVQTTILSVKVSTLICFHAMIKVLDKFTVQEKLIPLLKNIKTKEPAVMLATLGVYDEVGKIADKEIIATEILPQLWRMSFGPLLNLEQFKKFMKTIHNLTDRVEEAHTKHLQEVKSLEEQTRHASSSVSTPKSSNQPSNVDSANMSFESLVQGGMTPSFHPSSNNDLSNDSSNEDMFGALVSNTTATKPSAMPWSSPAQPSMSPMSKQTNSNFGSSAAVTNNIQQSLNPSKDLWNNFEATKSVNNISPSSNTASMMPNNMFTAPSVIRSSPIQQTIKPLNGPKAQQPLSSPPFTSSTTNTATSLSQLPINQISMSKNGSNLNNNINLSNTFSSNNTAMKPMNTTSGILKPLSPNSNNASSNNSTPKLSKAKLHAFDPLG